MKKTKYKDGLEHFGYACKEEFKEWGFFELLLVIIFFPWSLFYMGWMVLKQW